jgi:hypothetical protein
MTKEGQKRELRWGCEKQKKHKEGRKEDEDGVVKKLAARFERKKKKKRFCLETMLQHSKTARVLQNGIATESCCYGSGEKKRERERERDEAAEQLRSCRKNAQTHREREEETVARAQTALRKRRTDFHGWNGRRFSSKLFHFLSISHSYLPTYYLPTYLWVTSSLCVCVLIWVFFSLFLLIFFFSFFW